mmetsp:Transcript_1849/g.3960  ORF Transcript_1849/g.3960 Transcript_1849/m.3960 type:complete len:215 (+) Transcript_1849:3-647(+)
MKQQPTAPSAEETAATIQIIKQEIEVQEARQRLVCIEAETQRKLALDRWRAKDEEGVLRALKLKKEILKQLETIEGTIMSMDAMVFALEAAVNTTSSLSVLAEANSLLKKLYYEDMMQSIENLNDEIEESQQMSKDVGNFLSLSISTTDSAEEDELLLQELDEFKADEVLSMIRIPQELHQIQLQYESPAFEVTAVRPWDGNELKALCYEMVRF